jgi:oxygen-independent coproporphyrinogen-3 oxidase
VQELSPDVQEAIGRIQPFAVVESAVALLRENGIERVNLDLMYGLPKQSIRDVENTARLADLLQAQRVAVFGYAHVPWFKPHQRLIREADLPSAPERLAQAEAAHKTLLGLGYLPIGLDHYARPDDEMALAARTGRLHRNFQGYTTDRADALIGLGASAIGRLPQGFVQNAPDTGGYARAVASGRLATAKGVAISDDDRMRAHIIERLMCDLEVDLATVARGYPCATGFTAELEGLRALEREGVLVSDGRRLRLTEKGRPYVRLVAAAFDAYLPRGKARHSAAV